MTITPARAMFWLTLTGLAFALACYMAYLTGHAQARNLGY